MTLIKIKKPDQTACRFHLWEIKKKLIDEWNSIKKNIAHKRKNLFYYEKQSINLIDQLIFV